eukprot:Skav213749  [mRNA]  locus=scaffold258:84069:88598:+ [translate_table: standard]
MLQSLALVSPQFWTFSFPCQPWSSAGNQKGISCIDGKVFVNGMLLARFMRPRHIMLENVQNIMEHEDYKHVQQVVAYCGYRFLHQGIHDAAERLPCKRPRFLAVLERMEEEPSVMSWDSWGAPNLAAPCIWDAFVYSGDQELRMFQLKQPEFAQYMDPKLLPKTAPLAARNNILRYRVPSESQKLPVCMASYGNHHNLPEALLEEKGLMGHFTMERAVMRWFKPLELAFLHCQVQSIVLLAPARQSWQHIGNSIVFHHAYMALWNTLKQVFRIPEQATLAKHIATAEKLRLKSTTAVMQSDAYAWYATMPGQQSLAHVLHLMVTSMKWDGNPNPTWPVNTYFDPQQGALAIDSTHLTELQLSMIISPTLPMPQDDDQVNLEDKKNPEAREPLTAMDASTHHTEEHVTPHDRTGFSAPGHDGIVNVSPPQVHPSSHMPCDQMKTDLIAHTDIDTAHATHHPLPSQPVMPTEWTGFSAPAHVGSESPEIPKHCLEATVPREGTGSFAPTHVGHAMQPHATGVPMGPASLCEWSGLSAPAHTEEDAAPNEPMNQQPELAQPVQVMPYLVPGTYGCLTISSEMTTDDVVSLWDHQVLPCTLLHYECITEAAMQAFMMEPAQSAWLAPTRLVDTYQVLEFPSKKPTILIHDENTTTKAMNVTGQTWSQLIQNHFNDKHVAFDEFGRIPPDFLFDMSTRIFDVEPPLQTVVDAFDVAKHLNRISVEQRTPCDTDMLIYVLRGPSEALAVAATLWHIALDIDWQKQHSRHLAFQAVSASEVHFLFRPSGIGFATPSTILRNHVLTRLFRTMIASIDKQDAQHTLRFKMDHRIVATCRVDQLPAAFLLAVGMHTFGTAFDGHTPSYVAKGRRITEHTDMEDIMIRMPGQPAYPAKLHLIMPMTGGVGAKNEHRQFLHTEIAAVMLEHGMSMHDVPACVEQLLKHAGLPKLTHIVCNLKPEAKTQQIQRMCQELNIPWPNAPVNRAQRKFQKLGQQRSVREAKFVQPDHYRLQAGYFVLEDGTPAPIKHDLVPGSTGIVMTTPSQAEPWLQPGTKCSPDPFALFILGPLPCAHAAAVQITAPAQNLQGEPCLLGGWLVQLGEAKILPSKQEQSSVQTNDVHSCAFTMWKEDFEPDTWDQVTQAPVRFARKILEKDGAADILMSPHGRTYRQDNQPCQAAKATSVQFHAEVKVADLRPVLRRSGHNKLYITPKDDQGRASPLWRVIWLQLTKEVIQVRSSAFPSAAGLVKGRQSYGVRVEAKHFIEMWNHFNPGVEPPNHSAEGTVWKVHPLPAGVDRAVLIEWAKAYGWDITPTRPLGQKAWLFTSSQEPPQKPILYFNSTPLILKKMDRPQAATPFGLIAGPRSKIPSQEGQSNAASSTATSAFKLGDPYYDPWTKGQPAKTTGEVTMQSGPTQKHLEQHDQQLQALEDAMKKLNARQEQQARDTQDRFGRIETQVQQNHAETQGAFQAFQIDFDSSLKQAMSDQEQRISSTLDELKQLMLRNEKRKTPGEGVDDML